MVGQNRGAQVLSGTGSGRSKWDYVQLVLAIATPFFGVLGVLWYKLENLSDSHRELAVATERGLGEANAEMLKAISHIQLQQQDLQNKLGNLDQKLKEKGNAVHTQTYKQEEPCP